MIQTRDISLVEEKRIVTGLITSTKFTEQIFPVLDLDYFKNSYLKIIAGWCTAFFEEHKTIPYKHIQDIYESESLSLKESDSELIGTLLKTLSSQYDPESVNSEFLVNSAIDYFRKRELEIVVNNVSVLKEKGEYDEAEDEIKKFTSVAVNLDSGSLINIGNIDTLEGIYKEREEEDKKFFQLPGDLGRYLGNFKRGDVVGYYAPAKRGKCMSGLTFVYLPNGKIMKIKDVVNRRIKNILCLDKHGKIVEGEITDWIYSGMKDGYQIQVKSKRKIISSKDHRYFTPTGWKRLHELKIGDRIAMSKFIPCFSDKSINPKKLKVLAYLIADGNLKKYNISFTKHSDEIMQDFISCLPKSNTYRFEKEGTCINLHQGKVPKLIDKVGLIEKLSGDKFIPDMVMTANNESLAIFLNILFTCDGSIWKDRNCVHIDYSTKSYMLSQQLLCCLSRFNIFGKIRERIVNNETYYEIVISSNQGVIDFVNKIGFSFSKQEKAIELTKDLDPKRDYIDCIPKEFVQETGMELTKKGLPIWDVDRFGNAYKHHKHCSRYTFEQVCGPDHKYLNTDILWDEIISIEKQEKVPMYDLSVKDNHNFIADSFIVHNSWTLVDNYKHAVLGKRKVIFWSIEMTRTEIIPRIMKSFVPMIEEGGIFSYPAFDCKKNQTGDCGDRLSPTIVRDGEDIFEDPTHITCTKCMNNIELDHEYEMAVWHENIYRKPDDIFTIRKMFKDSSFQKMLNKYGRVSVHPKYTLTYDKMMRDIEVFNSIDGFIPDIFIIDYVDILQIGSKFDDYRSVDEAWKLMARMAGEFNALVITATQANKEGHKAESLDATHQGGFYGKNQHVNLMVGLNQKPEEKEQGIIRYGITEARSQHYIPGKHCTVLQDFAAGQVYLDSYYQRR